MIPRGTRGAKVYCPGTDEEDFEGHGFDIWMLENRFVRKRDGAGPHARMADKCMRQIGILWFTGFSPIEV